MSRDYAVVVEEVKCQVRPAMDRRARMALVADLLWAAFGERGGVSWVGFYLVGEGGRDLVLGPRRDQPACSPIGLQGVCGQSYLSRRPVVVEDVRRLGANYIACDPRDLSEVVVPLLDEEGRCWAVLDLDSHAVAAFDESDVQGLQKVLAAAGLSAAAS